MTDLNLDGLTDAQKRLLAVRCVRRVQHLMTDPRFVAALDVAERHAKGDATDEELRKASAAARVAARDASLAAWDAAWDAARAAVRDAAWAAAWAAASDAADAAWYAAWDAADAARAAERAEQQKILDEIREVKP